MTLPFFTIDHSNRSLEEFLRLLKEAQVQRVVDVRKIPMSRANPNFNKDTLPGALAPFQISYKHIAELGGFRWAPAGGPTDINDLWKNKSFRNYADYAMSEPFQKGLARLIEEGRHRRCVIMCSEAVWWRCHRRLIADNLIARGEAVFHIMGHNRIEIARMTSGAVVRPDSTVVYPSVASNVN